MSLRFPISCIVLCLVASLTAQAGSTFTRSAMLEAMARNCIVRGLDELHVQAQQLSSATQQLLEKPSQENLSGAQQAWINLQLTHKRHQMLFHGPVRDRAFWTALFFKQAYPTAVDNVLRSTREINADFIEMLGSSAKGFYVIEYLLFDLPQGANVVGGDTNRPPRLNAQLLLEGTTSARRQLYVRELARDLETQLRAALVEAQSADFVPKFVAGGQDSINLLVNQIADGIEGNILLPLNVMLEQVDQGSLRYDAIEGVASGTSLSSLSAMLEGVRRYYTGEDGLGVDDYAKHVNADLFARLEAQFQVAEKALQAVRIPIETAVVSDRAAVEKATEELKTLELLCKVDLVAALGVTIMFSSNDGD